MSARIRARDTGGTLRTPSRIRVRDETGALRAISRIRIRNTANVLQTVFENLGVTIPDAVSASSSGAAHSGTVTTASVTPTVSGAASPFTYEWAFVSGNPSITITSPTGSSTTFSALVADTGVPKEAYFLVTVTDSLGTVIESNQMLVSLEWVDTR